MESTVLRVRTGSRLITDLTGGVADWVADKGDGLLSVFVPHATAGLAVMETGAGSESDVADMIDRLLPADDIYRHRHGSVGHGRDHVLPSVVSPAITVPVVAGRIPWGTWQSLVLVDSNRDNPDRSVRLSFLAG